MDELQTLRVQVQQLAPEVMAMTAVVDLLLGLVCRHPANRALLEQRLRQAAAILQGSAIAGSDEDAQIATSIRLETYADRVRGFAG